MLSSFSRFLDVYDFFGYILVGSMGLLVILLDFAVFGQSIPNFGDYIVWVFLYLSFILGNLIQIISNIIAKIHKSIPFLREKIKMRKPLTAQEKDILMEFKKRYEITSTDFGEVLRYRYFYAISNDKTGQISKFVSVYGYIRGWATVFALNTVFFFVVGIQLCLKHTLTPTQLVIFLFSLSLALLLIYRLFRFSRYIDEKVAQTCLFTLRCEE